MSDKLSVGEIFERYKNLPEFDGLQFTDVNQRGNLGNALLHVASTNGELNEVLSLLEAGADPNLKGEDGSTPLYDAVSQRHYEVAKALFEHGASADTKIDIFEMSPKDYAAQYGLKEFSAIFKTDDMT